MKSLPLYFDYAATTPVDERVIQVMVECLGMSGNFGNPASSSHVFGQQARVAVEQARRQVAELVGAQAGQIIWTSGATESNNLALKGVAQGTHSGWARRLAISSPARSNTRQSLIPRSNFKPQGMK
jgi:cysteine desulfurase